MKYWINVISKDHALAGVEGGFIQANQGKAGNLHLLREENIVFVYSPGTLFRAGQILQAFTAVARVTDEAPSEVETSAKIHPWRRKTTALACEEAPDIEPLIPHLDFIQDAANWGMSLRRDVDGMDQEDARDRERDEGQPSTLKSMLEVYDTSSVGISELPRPLALGILQSAECQSGRRRDQAGVPSKPARRIR